MTERSLRPHDDEFTDARIIINQARLVMLPGMPQPQFTGSESTKERRVILADFLREHGVAGPDFVPVKYGWADAYTGHLANPAAEPGANRKDPLVTTTTNRPSRAIDMTGQTFHDLTVLERAPNLPGQTGAAWLCECKCGGEIVVTGTSLRKGDKKSCGCRKGGPRGTKAAPMRKPSPPAPVVVGRWAVVERDGLLTLVGNPHGDEALVEFLTDRQSWACSECGEFLLATAKNGLQVCGHITAATRALPLALALDISIIAAPRRGASLGARGGDALAGGQANEKAQAVALANSAIERAERNRPRDEQFLRIVGPVTTRPITEADRAKLEQRRRAKAKSPAH